MAYLRDLEVQCQNHPCQKKATKELINSQNGSCGKFCRHCAKFRLKELLRLEHPDKA